MAPSYEIDIRPLFRTDDVDAMSFAFNLASYEDVKANASDIYERIMAGDMPCDGAWPAEQVRLFRDWLDSGLAP